MSAAALRVVSQDEEEGLERSEECEIARCPAMEGDAKYLNGAAEEVVGPSIRARVQRAVRSGGPRKAATGDARYPIVFYINNYDAKLITYNTILAYFIKYLD
jgi:hypothetical protein